MNTQKGSIGSLVIVIIALFVIGGVAYIYTKNNSKNENIGLVSRINSITTTSNTQAIPSKDISDAQVVAALNADFVSPESHPNSYKTNSKFYYKLQKDAQGKDSYTVTVTESTSTSVNTVLGIYKGDLNGDSYDDAFVWVNSCNDSDCGYGTRIVINSKDGTGIPFNFSGPYTISGWSGGSETQLDSVKIDQGIIYITSSTFKDSADYKVAENLPKQTKKFILQDNKLIEVK